MNPTAPAVRRLAHRRFSGLAVALVAAGVALVACGGDEAADAVDDTPAGGAGADAGGNGSGAAAGSAGHAAAAGAVGAHGGNGNESGSGGNEPTAGSGGSNAEAGADQGGSGGDEASGGGDAGSAGDPGDGGAAGEGGEGGSDVGSAGAGGTGSAGKGGTTGGAGKGGGNAGPTCKQAGGDRCGKTKGDCAGLTTVDSSDCNVCCKVPKNPIIATGWADPYIVRSGDTYYAFATGGTVRRRSSKNLVSWSAADDALSKSPWKQGSAGFWAPTVYKAKSGKWVMYYAAETNAANNTQHCIGKAVANSITGTFQPVGTKPIICGSSFWSIDPSVFEDNDGKDYLLWRQDTAAQSKGNVYIQQLDKNGDLTGGSHQLISRASKEPSWEFDGSGGVMENPAMVRNGSVYHLFYSGNRWETKNYANGHATCTAPFGPCKKTSTTNPWQGSKGQMLGPGGADTVKAADGTLFMYMHGWDSPDVGPDKGTRKLWLYRLDFAGQTPSLSNP
jgi:GH43 family beta-xylosidase